MASLQELNSYTGNAALGAGTSGNNTQLGTGDFTGTMSAVDKFSQLHFTMNRDLWLQRNKEVQEMAKDAATNLAFEYGDLIDRDRPVIDGAVKELYQFYHDNPNAVRYNIDPTTGQSNAKDYQAFLAKKNKVDHLIKRGNERALQLLAIQKDKAAMKDQRMYDRYEQHEWAELTKDIEENLVLMPPIAEKSFSGMVQEAAQGAGREYKFATVGYNDNFEHNIKVTDIMTASAQLMQQSNNDPEAGRIFQENYTNFNQVLKGVLDQAPRGADGQISKDGALALLKGSDTGQVIYAMQQRANEAIDRMNSGYVVDESGHKTKRKLREAFGYNQEIPKINVLNGIDKNEFALLAVADKASFQSSTDVAHTGAGQQAATLAWNKTQYYDQVRRGEEGETALADEINMRYVNIANVPINGGGQKVAITTTAPDGTTTSQDFGYEVGLDNGLINALSKSADKNVQTTRTPNEGGAAAPDTPPKSLSFMPEDGNKSNYTQVATEKKTIRPTRFYVVPSPDGDLNKNRYHVRYEDNSTKTISNADFYAALNYSFGEDGKVASSVSSLKTKSLKRMGMTQPDVNVLTKKMGTFKQGATERMDRSVRKGGAGGTKAAAPAKTAKPKSWKDL